MLKNCALLNLHEAHSASVTLKLRYVAILCAILAVQCSSPNQPNTDDASEVVHFRFDSDLHLAANVNAPTFDRPPDLASFDFADESNLQWTLHGERASASVEDGVWRVRSGARFAFIQTSPKLSLRPHLANAISIRMRIEGADAVTLKWRNRGDAEYSDRAVLRIGIPAQGEWRTYTIDTLSLPGWLDPRWMIGDLYIEFPRNTLLELDSLQVVSKTRHFSESPVGKIYHPIRYDLRSCLYLTTPSSVEFAMQPPPRGRLSFGCGVLNANVPVTFQLYAANEGSRTVLFEKTIAYGENWQEFSVPLDAYAGTTTTLGFASSSENGTNVAFWSNPVLYGAPEHSRAVQIDPDEPRTPMNVIIYLVDCLRADHLECYGYERSTAPALADVAARGTRFSRFFSHETWTNPSVANLLTGVLSSVHGVISVNAEIPDRISLLPELLREAGYATIGLNENAGNGPPFAGMNRGFSSSVRVLVAAKQTSPSSTPEDLSDDMHNRAVAFMKAHRHDPFFLYYHTMECHAPYHVGDEYRIFETDGIVTDVDAYDATIRRADDNIGRLVSAVNDLGLAKNTLFVILADHGEAFGEHDGHMRHVGKPYNNQIHVPLVFYLPGFVESGAVVDTNVQFNDIAPTLLDLLGIEKPAYMEGISLAPFLRGHTPAQLGERSIVSFGMGAISLLRGDWKMLLQWRTGTARLFNIETDYNETRDLAEEYPEILNELREEWERIDARSKALAKSLRAESEDSTVRVDAEREEALKALGYID